MSTFLFLLLLLSVLAEAAFIHALPSPMNAYPLIFSLGILIIHRKDPWLGALWLSLGVMLLSMTGFDHHHWWAYVLAMPFAGIMTKKVFASRSVYALVGLGLTTFTSIVVLERIVLFATHLVIRDTLIPVWSTKLLLTEYLLLALSLYIGFLFAQTVERLSKSVFYIRTNS